MLRMVNLFKDMELTAMSPDDLCLPPLALQSPCGTLPALELVPGAALGLAAFAERSVNASWVGVLLLDSMLPILHPLPAEFPASTPASFLKNH